MVKLPTAIEKFLPYLTEAQQAQCRTYLEAREAEKAVTVNYRLVLKERHAAQRLTYQHAEKLDKHWPEKQLEDGQIVFNIRNRMYYEVCREKVKPVYGSSVSFLKLQARTARRSVCRSVYGGRSYLWGPRAVLPESHPFVQKRINARLAERLEGKD